MKRILSFLLFVYILSGSIFAQAPQALNYQAVARTSDGVIIPTQNISVRFSVLDVNVTGAVLYSETHQTTTNSYGLFTLQIGKGVPATGTFPAINWASGTDKFLKVEIAPAGGSNYQLQGTTQLLSVPYALYSEKTRLIAGNNTINITNGNTITGNYQAANNTVLLTGNTIAGNYQAANNTIAINDNTIAGNYQAANNTISLNGNTIAGNYQPANNTIAINGNTIAGNYQAGTGININGNTISHNFLAGTGITITGNTISSTGSSKWQTAPNGIRNISGNVGIGMNPHPIVPLSVFQPNSNAGNAVLHLISDDIYHTALTMFNTSTGPFPAVHYTFSIGGSNNTEIGAGNFALFNHQALNFILTANASNSFVGIGAPDPAPTPKSRLHVFNGDVNIDQIGSGIIMKSPNGNCWRITIDNTGNLVRTAIACPN